MSTLHGVSGLVSPVLAGELTRFLCVFVVYLKQISQMWPIFPSSMLHIWTHRVLDDSQTARTILFLGLFKLVIETFNLTFLYLCELLNFRCCNFIKEPLPSQPTRWRNRGPPPTALKNTTYQFKIGHFTILGLLTCRTGRILDLFIWTC